MTTQLVVEFVLISSFVLFTDHQPAITGMHAAQLCHWFPVNAMYAGHRHSRRLLGHASQHQKCVCLFVHVCVCACVYVCVRACMWVHGFMHVGVVCACGCVCVHECVQLLVFVPFNWLNTLLYCNSNIPYPTSSPLLRTGNPWTLQRVWLSNIERGVYGS